ncbi:MAG TPA: ADP-ribosylglycohydrolase family protein, partial [Clostridia bacterium]|nr:ADP-ribosylglycohydrolase family protein [Clostridia bacterium]
MIRRILEAYAVGDAMGMPTEFMTRDAIKARFGAVVDRLLRPDEGEKHKNLPYASV